jgi:hypothetical protein
MKDKRELNEYRCKRIGEAKTTVIYANNDGRAAIEYIKKNMDSSDYTRSLDYFLGDSLVTVENKDLNLSWFRVTVNYRPQISAKRLKG